MAINVYNRYSTYPKIIIPKNISVHFDKEYSDIEICKELNIEYPKLTTLRLPSEPQKVISIRKEKTKIEFKGGCMFIFALPVFIFCVFGVFTLMSVNIFWPIPIFILFLYVLNKNFGVELRSYTVYEDSTMKDEEFERIILQYNSNIESISKNNDDSKIEYNKKLRQTKKIISENYIEVSKSIFYKQFTPKVGLKKNNFTNKRGRSELFFLTKLHETFKNSITIDVVIDDKSLYHPDFVIIDNETNFHVDIEIDEPYAVENGTPIHHDRSDDETRNSYFEELNWGVIRFTEKQIIKYPNECCELIAQVLYKIKNKKNIITHDVEIEKEWSYEEALIMKENDYRNSYLPKNMKIQVRYKNQSKYNNSNDEEDDYEY